MSKTRGSRSEVKSQGSKVISHIFSIVTTDPDRVVESRGKNLIRNHSNDWEWIGMAENV